MKILPIMQGSVYWPSAEKYHITVWYSDGSTRETFCVGSILPADRAVELREQPDNFKAEMEEVAALAKRRRDDYKLI